MSKTFHPFTGSTVQEANTKIIAGNVELASTYQATPETEPSDHDLANGQALVPGMGRRMLAYMMDFFLIFAISLAAHLLVLWLLSGHEVAARLANLYVLACLMLLVNAGHHIFLESNSVLRGTVGKYLCGLQVVDVNGDALDRVQAQWRFLWRLPSIALFMLPYLMAGRGSYALALHDRKAFTIVTTRLPAARLQSGLLAGRARTKLDTACLVFAGIFLTCALLRVLVGLLL